MSRIIKIALDTDIAARNKLVIAVAFGGVSKPKLRNRRPNQTTMTTSNQQAQDQCYHRADQAGSKLDCIF
jgi:hypothetical protein